MALSESAAKRLFDKLKDLQRQMEEIQNELLIEMYNDELSPEEIIEIKAIREEDDYRTLKEWGKEGLGFQLDVEKD